MAFFVMSPKVRDQLHLWLQMFSHLQLSEFHGCPELEIVPEIPMIVSTSEYDGGKVVGGQVVGGKGILDCSEIMLEETFKHEESGEGNNFEFKEIFF